ncbi:hypothetical protein PBCV1_a511L [Paramecium bursaria Chlorella virus 1]|uniref:Uncharacterized protein n=1 Tax=Paramecium bursaria Chlorella virus 1 TaxID=10506 RepID=Q98561_PBCV1|nr:hypothetical protein PBCV1_a511L [Paramecium bursaria Chlorella virus 1]AAC96878.1 hypothetical protein [Paramecium bursaria Chlorella virus 1]
MLNLHKQVHDGLYLFPLRKRREDILDIINRLGLDINEPLRHHHHFRLIVMECNIHILRVIGVGTGIVGNDRHS